MCMAHATLLTVEAYHAQISAALQVLGLNSIPLKLVEIEFS